MHSLPSSYEQEEEKNIVSSYETIHERPVPQKEKNENFFIETVKFSILALAIVLPIRFFVAQPFIVSGASMAPTFQTGNYLIVDQLTYHFRAPERGDVVVFRYPNDTSVFFIKRIIGLPRETVRIDEEGTHIIDQTGKETLLKEPFTAPHTQNADGVVSLTLGADEYFVMGDNRDASSDSRVWGAVPAKDIMGRAFLRLLPASHLSLFPGYFHL